MGVVGPSDEKQAALRRAEALGEGLQEVGREPRAPGGAVQPRGCKCKGPGVGLGSVGWRPAELEWCERVGGRKLRGPQAVGAVCLDLTPECRRSRWKALSRAYTLGSLGMGAQACILVETVCTEAQGPVCRAEPEQCLL